jgi:hypothetical protein
MKTIIPVAIAPPSMQVAFERTLGARENALDKDDAHGIADKAPALTDRRSAVMTMPRWSW